MKRATWHQALKLLLVLGLVPAPHAALSYQGPRLSASFSVSGARPTAGGASLTFSFTLENLESAETTVERVELVGLSGADGAYATFDGGTLAGRGTIRGSAVATVPKSVFDRWEGGAPATLLVYTRTGHGDARRSRVDAYRSSLAP